LVIGAEQRDAPGTYGVFSAPGLKKLCSYYLYRKAPGVIFDASSPYRYLRNMSEGVASFRTPDPETVVRVDTRQSWQRRMQRPSDLGGATSGHSDFPSFSQKPDRVRKNPREEPLTDCMVLAWQ
jgi:hypothetical protein